MTDLDLSRVWVVDPATGREGPGEVVVREGILEAVTWLEDSDRDGVDPTGGSVDCWPARETCSVHAEPSQ